MRSERDLVQGIRKRDSGNFEEFVRRYQQRVYMTALRMAGERDDALDVAQEVFLKMWRFAPRLKEGLILERWVYRVTIYTCIDRLRERWRKTRHHVSDPDNLLLLSVAEKGMNPHEFTRLSEELHCVKKALSELTERQRTVFVLRHFQNLSMKEIAAVLSSPVGTIKATLHQTLEKLKGLLREDRIAGFGCRDNHSRQTGTQSGGLG